VVSDLSGTCINKDTVTITVVSDFSYVTAQSATSSCLLQPILFNATATPGGTYTYNWTPSTYLNSTTIPNPIATITSPGTYTYYVSITSPLGCTKVDTASVLITASYPPNPIALANDTTVCVGDTVILNATFGSSVPSVCGTNPVGCGSSIVNQVGFGTATNTSTTWPAPYANWYTSGKHQMLFTAAELTAAGITGGKIDQIEFNVVAIFGISAYHQYTINMGCTNLTSLTTWVPGLMNVYTPKTYNVVTGWNAHPFDVAYEWDGISNVIVEICFTEGPPYPNYTQSCESPYTTTAFTSCLYSLSDAMDMCPDLGFATAINDRPNVRFRHCGAAPDSSRYTYDWFPTAGGIQSPTSQVTAAVPGSATTYYVIVTDTVSGCSDTAYINIAADVTTISVNAGNDVTICPGQGTMLNATGASNYTWTPATALSSTTIPNPIANPVTTTTYTVVGTSQCASGSSSDEVTVNVPTASPLNATAGPDQEVCINSPFLLYVTSTGGYGSNSYSWTQISGAVGDSIMNANSANATVTPTVTTTNVYQVVVTDNCGYSYTDTIIVDVLQDCDLNIPNVFTPNGDGINDNFLITANGLKSYSITIYNRWGKKVFESADITNSWNGENVNDGTFFFVITAESINGKMFNESGHVQRIGDQ
jgi:gliding motility-associated-like protein